MTRVVFAKYCLHWNSWMVRNVDSCLPQCALLLLLLLMVGL